MFNSQVQLITMTIDPIDSVVQAILTCRSGKDCHSVRHDINQMTTSAKADLVHKVLKMQHMSVIEHVSFTFSVENISRSCSHQLVRHRLTAITQESQRAVNMSTMQPIIPDSILQREDCRKLFDYIIDVSKNVYDYFVDSGVPLEDARYIMPNATPTRMVYTANARELHHIFDMRLCLKAENEIRGVVTKMKNIVTDVCPVLFPLDLIGPMCNSMSMCKQHDSECPNFIKLKNKISKTTSNRMLSTAAIHAKQYGVAEKS